MKIIVAWPPNIEDIKKKFDLKGKRPIFAWGHFIFNPYSAGITEDLLEHETVHSIQQDKMGPVEWWKLYLNDPEFRLAQEIPAYQVQYQNLCKKFKDGNARYRIAYRLAGDLSGAMYGNMIPFDQAITLIKNGN